MLDGIIHALASYNRLEERKERNGGDLPHLPCHEARIAVHPSTAHVLENFIMFDGRSLLDHIIEGREIYEDLDQIGKAT